MRGGVCVRGGSDGRGRVREWREWRGVRGGVGMRGR